MKKTTTKLILGLSAIFALNTANGQNPIITSANQAHSIGDVTTYTNLSDFGFDPNIGGGANVTWNYSNVFPSGVPTVHTFVDAATAPQASLYPTATIAMEISGVAGNEWFVENPTSLTRLGLSSPDPNVGSIVYNGSSFHRYEYPFTAGDFWSSNYTGTSTLVIAGATVTIDAGVFTANVDAFGTLFLPDGTGATDVVRIHVVESFSFVADLGGSIPPLNIGDITDDFYYWFVEGVQDPVLIFGTTDLQVQGSNDPPTKTLHYQAGVLPLLNPTGIDEQNLAAKVAIYPNPSNGIFNLNIPTELNKNVNIKVLNVLGATVFTNITNGSNNQVNLSHLDKGIYFMNISNDQFQITKRIIIK